MRSNSGPEILSRYRLRASGKQVHSRFGSIAKPHGHGFIAAPIMKRAGHTTVPLARLTEMDPSSIGSRKASKTLRLNSGSSSKKRTPLCARLASPGARRDPPPTKETIDAEWWGVRKGREVTGLNSPESPARLAHE